MTSVIVDDTDPRIRYSPRGQWKANDVCVACDVSSRDMIELRKDAFNSTWHAAPGAQLDFKTMTIDFNFSGSDVAATFIFFRRTDERGRTRDDGQSNLFISLDNGDRQRIPLTLDAWKPQELQQQYRIFEFQVPSAEPGSHTLNIQFTRNSAMDVPVTVALDRIRFKELSSNGTQADPGPSPTQDSAGSPSDSASPAGTPSNAPQGQGRATNIAKIVAPVAAVVLFVLLLIGVLLCWRRRRIEKQRRLKASIRTFKPVLFDPYPQKLPPFNYEPDDARDLEKPTPIVPAYSLRGPSVVGEPFPLLLSSPDSINSQRMRNSADSTSQPSFNSYEQQWRLAASQKRPVSTASDRKSPTGPHFVVVNR